MDQRFNAELPPSEARELWTATRILMGLKWSSEIVGQVLKGVRNMRESVTYQEIVEEGVEIGRMEGRVTEAKAILLQGATIRFGEPDAAARAKLDSIKDLQTLERMTQRLFEGANSWNQLLD